MKLFVVTLSLMCSLLIPMTAFSAETTPIQLSLFHPAQLFPKETKVHGLRINLPYGINDEMIGIDFGLINKTTGLTQGLQLGLFPLGGINITEELEGIQFAGFYAGANIANGNVSGLQISGLFAGYNKAYDLQGVQIAGILVGANLAKNVDGIQLASLYNKAEEIKGMQIGIVNVCNKMKGVQLGLVNIIEDSVPMFLPIINARF